MEHEEIKTKIIKLLKGLTVEDAKSILIDIRMYDLEKISIVP